MIHLKQPCKTVLLLLFLRLFVCKGVFVSFVVVMVVVCVCVWFLFIFLFTIVLIWGVFYFFFKSTESSLHPSLFFVFFPLALETVHKNSRRHV